MTMVTPIAWSDVPDPTPADIAAAAELDAIERNLVRRWAPLAIGISDDPTGMAIVWHQPPPNRRDGQLGQRAYAAVEGIPFTRVPLTTHDTPGCAGERPGDGGHGGHDDPGHARDRGDRWRRHAAVVADVGDHAPTRNRNMEMDMST